MTDTATRVDVDGREAEARPLWELYASWRRRFADHPDLDLVSIRDQYDGWGRVTAEPEGVTYRSETIEGVRAIWAIPSGANTDFVLIHAHGGGYLGGSPDSHRKLTGHLARAAGVPAVVYAYGLAPENRFPDVQLDDTDRVWSSVLASGVDPRRIGLIGDSAGGGIVTLFSLRQRDRGAPLPGAIVALSPMLDLTAESTSLARQVGIDLLAGPKPLAEAVAMLLGPERVPTDPSVNPFFADLTGLPPYLFEVGGDEGLVDDSTHFAERLLDAGVYAEVTVEHGQQHVFQFLAGRSSVADASIARVADFLRVQLGIPA